MKNVPVGPRKLRLGKFEFMCRPENRHPRRFGRGQYMTSGGSAAQEVVLESFHLWPFEVVWHPKI